MAGGEWGAFRLSRTQELRRTGTQAAGISITSCRETQCSFSITVHELDGSHGEANGTLRIGSEATADGQIEAHGYGYQCSLSVTKAGSQPPAIIVKQISPGCSNFLTPGASFAHTFPLRSKSNFYGNDLPLCYLAEDTARVALCGSQPLSKLEDDWRMLSYKTSDLSRKPIEVPEEEGKLVRAPR